MLYKHSLKNYSSNRKIGIAEITGTVHVSIDVSYIGSADRVFIAGISKNTKKCLFIRDIKLENSYYENKIVSEKKDEIEIFLNIKSKSPVWVEIERLLLVCNRVKNDLLDNDKKKSINATLSNHLQKNDFTEKKEISNLDVKGKSIYRNEIIVKLNNFNSIMLEGYDQDCNLVLKRKITSEKWFKTILRTNQNSHNIKFYVHKKVDIDIIENNLIFLDKVFDSGNVKINGSSITAAMATYPAREHVLCDAIDSIIDQVDCLFIYLNNYEQIPDIILDHPKRNKIEVVVDPKSNLRAAAKFFWLSNIEGYHLTIDDDIIYPENYVARLVAACKSFNDNAIIGVHGSIFNKFVKDASKCRSDIFNFQEGLESIKRVHMIGSGTSIFPNKIAKEINISKLFQHPLANDELLALIAKDKNIPIYAIDRDKGWMKSNPNMEYGIFEEKQLNKEIKSEVSSFISSHNPWPTLI